MSKITHLPKQAARTAPPRSPARIALAAAIERLAEVRREVEETATARNRLSEMRSQAIHAEDAAKAAIEKAKTNASAYYTSIALGTAGERPQSVKEAHAAHAAAVDESESLTNAASSLRAKAEELERRIGFASNRINDAVQAVIADEGATIAQQLAAEYEVVARDLADRQAVLYWLANRGAFGDGVQWHPPIQQWAADLTDLPGAQAWRIAGDALKAVPDAPLPTPAPEPRNAA